MGVKTLENLFVDRLKDARLFRRKPDKTRRCAHDRNLRAAFDEHAQQSQVSDYRFGMDPCALINGSP